MRLILLILVALIAYDAIANDGAYTKAAWAEVESWFDGARAESR